MGSGLSLFKFQGGDALINRCWDFTAERTYLCKLKDNLKDLKTAKEKLSDLRGDVERMVLNELVVGPLKIQKDQVKGWDSRVKKKIAEVDALLIKGEAETKKLFLCGCCSENCMSSSRIGRKVARRLKEVTDLINDGDFKEVVIIAPAKQLEANLLALESATEELLALVRDTRNRIRSDEGPEKKPLQQVIQWILHTESVIDEAKDLLDNGKQETNKLESGDISKLMFAARVAKSLKDVDSQKAKCVFGEVVSRAPIEPDYVSGKTLTDLKTKTDQSRGKFILYHGRQKKPLSRLELWRSMVVDSPAEADDLIRDGPQEIDKLSRRNYSNYKKLKETVTKTLNDAVALKADGSSQEMIHGALLKRNSISPLGMGNLLEEACWYLVGEDGRIINIIAISFFFLFFLIWE